VNKSTTILVTIILTALIVGSATYLWQKGEIDSLRGEIESQQDDMGIEGRTDTKVGNTVSEASSDLKTYGFDSLGLSFPYPKKVPQIVGYQVFL